MRLLLIRAVVICVPSMRVWTITLMLIFGAHLPAAGAETSRVRVGPAESPDDWPDWGGTPDLDLADEMGLTEEELSALFERMRSSDTGERARAVAEMRRDAPGSVAVIKKHLFRGHGARNAEMKVAMREAKRRGENSKQGVLEGLITIQPSHETLGKGAVGALRVLAMLNALDDLDSLAGYKVMMEFSPRHAGVFRHEIGRMLVAHGMKVMPALIYGRGNADKEIHMFAVKWIRDLGDPLLSEQVKIDNPRRLAQLLEAYASVNDLDAIDVTLALTNHRSSFVRNGARSALRAYGRNALWPARRQYENTFSRVPDNDATVEEVLAELYQHYDKQRLGKSMQLFERGQRLFLEGKLEEMSEVYQEVLKRAPMFPRRGEMAAGFLAYSNTFDTEGEEIRRVAALKMALRVAEEESREAKLAKGDLLWLQTERLRRSGLVAPEIYERILALNPEHSGAQAMLKELDSERGGRTRLIPKAMIVSFILFLASVLVYARIKSSRVG